MAHELKESPEAIELSVTAPSREELFRSALSGLLEAAYGAPIPSGSYEGRVVPIQASGADDDALLAELAHDALRAVREEPGTVQPPRWLAFDERRATATLPLHTPRAPARILEVTSARIQAAGSEWRAVLELLPSVDG